MAENHPFGERLHKHLSRQRGLSQNKLATSIGVNPSVIARMCKGDFPSTVELLNQRVCKIVDFLNNAKVIESQDEANGFFIDVGLLPPNLQTIDLKIRDNNLAENQSIGNISKITVLMEGNFPDFDLKKKEGLILLLSILSKVELEDIRILRVEPGSIRITIEIPERAIEKLNNLTEEDKNMIKEAGIISILYDNRDYMDEVANLADPILIQSVTFLLNEVKEILAERHQSRTARAEPDDRPPSNASFQTANEILNLAPKKALPSDIKEEIKSYIHMIELYRKNLHNAETVIQEYGGFYQAPPIKRIELKDAEKGIQEYAQRLKDTIEKVYGHKISIVGLYNK